jgi:hypothetical protein
MEDPNGKQTSEKCWIDPEDLKFANGNLWRKAARTDCLDFDTLRH